VHTPPRTRVVLFGALVVLTAIAVAAGLGGSQRTLAGIRLLDASDAKSLDSRLSRPARIGKAPRYRHMIDSGAQAATVASYGWNLLDVSYKLAADELPAGTKALVWVGNYDKPTCTWQVPDSELTTKVRAMARDPKVAGYFISDEPDPYRCPSAPAQHAARTAMIHSLSPGKPAIMLMDSNSGKQSLDQMPLWRHAADYVALDPYPCYQGKPCDFGWIDTIIKAADRAGLHYWGVAQAFDDANWRWPTPTELRRMLSQWAASKESGYMTFAWTWRGKTLASRPDLLKVFRDFNRSVAKPKVKAKPKPRKTSAEAAIGAVAAGTATELHYTYGGRTSVTFDWDGTASTLRYGRTKRYGSAVTARSPKITPFSSKGPFRQVTITGLKPGETYHYSVGNVASTFSTPPLGRFRFDFEADVGASNDYSAVTVTQNQIVADRPEFVIVGGDLTYGNDNGLAAVDRHFNDVMAWSRFAAYMPAWGNHEWDEPSDDMRNYKGRFMLPHPQSSPDAPSKGCCGQDWGWFDAGGVRFIAYPDPYSYNSWRDWLTKAAPLMEAAQRNPKIHFIVTFGHRPAYSTGYHPGDPLLASEMNTLGDRYSKYVLNLNGHSHNYERFLPIHHVVHITAGGGGADLEAWSRGKDPRTAFRALHLEHLRVDVTAKQLRIQAICGPPASHEDVSCTLGSVIDSYTIGSPVSSSYSRSP
jgi:hypothetical protein